MKDILFSDNLRFRTYIYENNHYTDNRGGAPRHYFALLESGACRIVSAGRTLALEAGDLFYIPKGLPYQSYWTSRDQIRFRSLGFHYFPEWGVQQYPLQKIACSGEILKLFQTMPIGQKADSTLWGQFYSAVSAVLPCMTYEIPNSRVHILEQAKQYMADHIHCKTADVARHCMLSETVLYRIFREEAGCTPNSLRQQILCEKAILMLTTTDRTVQDISDTLGFSSTAYFRKILHKHTGKTPRQIRAAAGNF